MTFQNAPSDILARLQELRDADAPTHSGQVLPWLDDISTRDFRVRGVTSLSADLHKFGYAPQGALVLLQRGRDRQRAQYLATTR